MTQPHTQDIFASMNRSLTNWCNFCIMSKMTVELKFLKGNTHASDGEQACGSLPIQVAVRRSLKARRVVIRICRDRVELVIPQGASEEQAYSFMRSKETWIRNKLAVMAVRSKPDMPLKEQEEVSLLGEVYQVLYVDSLSKPYVEISNSLLTVYGAKEKASNVLKRYLWQYALIEIPALVKAMASKHGFEAYGKISVKEMGSRWGSCSSAGNLSFNWRLIFAPRAVLQYIIVHELCHLLEMNHGKKFWSLVANICPDYKAQSHWLKKHGHGLYQRFSDI